MTAAVSTKSSTSKSPRSGFVPNVISGLATGLFSIPEGMAYAQLAGVNPIYGMYSGIAATMVASLITGTVLMVSTLTSAIALATGSVLQYTIFLGALLSLLLYVVASARKFKLQQIVPAEDGGWETRDAPSKVEQNKATVLVVQGLDFFAEVPALDDRMPSARGVSGAVLILVLRDMHRITSTGIEWLERFAGELEFNGSKLILADVSPEVIDVLRSSGALEQIGSGSVIPSSRRVLAAENAAWEAAQDWLQAHPAARSTDESKPKGA